MSRNEYLIDKLCKLKVTKCPYFEYSNNKDYFGDCWKTQGYCDLQNCDYKKQQLESEE